MKGLCKRFLKDEAASTAIEYTIIASIVSLAIIAGALSIGGLLNTKLGDIAPYMKP